MQSRLSESGIRCGNEDSHGKEKKIDKHTFFYEIRDD